MPNDLRTALLDIVTSPIFQQVFPLIVLIVGPAFVFFCTSAIRKNMVFDGWSLWPFGGQASSSGSSQPRKKERKLRKHRSPNDTAVELSETKRGGGYYPGLVNISGTYCFMNSTLQAMASLSYLQPQIDSMHARAVEMNIDTPVIDALHNLFHRLNAPGSSPSAIRPMEMIEALSSLPSGRSNALFSSREHQDAQELFQLVSECIKNEYAVVEKELQRDRGLALSNNSLSTRIKPGKSVFDGLTANRRSCVNCGYTEAVMHFAFDSWQLSFAKMAPSYYLEQLLDEYTSLETLDDCICRHCSMRATYRRLQREVKTLAPSVEAPGANPSNSKRRRLKELRRMEAKVHEALQSGRIEEDIKDVRVEKIFGVSTKQAMIARPPPVLVLHINRSMHMSYYASKNNSYVIFNELLDLTPFTTSGNLSTVPTSSLSPHPPTRASTPTPETYNRTIYRLAGVVCHYGQHSFGHYICFRRKPPAGRRHWGPPRLVRRPPVHRMESRTDPGATEGDEQEEQDELLRDFVWEDGPSQWLRISDDSCVDVPLAAVLREGSGAFMLYYERATIVLSPPSSSSHSPAPMPAPAPIPVPAARTTSNMPAFSSSSYTGRQTFSSPPDSSPSASSLLSSSMSSSSSSYTNGFVPHYDPYGSSEETLKPEHHSHAIPIPTRPTGRPRIVRSTSISKRSPMSISMMGNGNVGLKA